MVGHRKRPTYSAQATLRVVLLGLGTYRLKKEEKWTINVATISHGDFCA